MTPPRTVVAAAAAVVVVAAAVVLIPLIHPIDCRFGDDRRIVLSREIDLLQQVHRRPTHNMEVSIPVKKKSDEFYLFIYFKS